MIAVNTTHIKPDLPYLLEDEESVDILELQDCADKPVPLVPVDKIHYKFFCSLAGNDLVVTGEASFKIQTICSRCCDDVTQEVCVENLCLHFPDVKDQIVDITEEVREGLLLAMPNYFFCSEDCQGICPGCGANLNYEPCTCPEDDDEDNDADQPKNSIDSANSPWSKLDELKF